MGASRKYSLFALLWVTSSLAKGINDHTVTCTSSEQCILPCQFQSDGKGARIMWYRKGAIVSCTRYGDTSFVIGSNAQVDSYRGRTSLFPDLVLEGNAALVLKNVTPRDQDKFFCVTMTDKVTGQSGVVSLVVKAPVQRVDIGFRDGDLTCSSNGICPRPSLVWSIEPPPQTGWLHNQTTVNETQQGFYDIHSSLQLKETDLTNKTYICRVETDTDHRMAFFKRQESVLVRPGTSVSVPCPVPLKGPLYNVTWTHGDREVVLSMTVTPQQLLVKVSERWKPHVPVELQSCNLTLVKVKREHQGNYSCEVNTPDERHTTLTELRVQQDYMEVQVYSVLFCSLVLILTALTLTFKNRLLQMFVGLKPCPLRRQKQATDAGRLRELEELRCSNPEANS